MSTKPRIPLTPIRTAPGDPAFQNILTWPFAERPFYEGQITRLLQHDIRYRFAYSNGMAWVYSDPNSRTVGFGTLDICKEYERFADGKSHSYIPLLAVHPDCRNLGHGRSIVEHLIAEAVLIAQKRQDFSDRLFLDVYTANNAVLLYEKCGFIALNPDLPIIDPEENSEPYIVMAKQVSIAAAT